METINKHYLLSVLQKSRLIDQFEEEEITVPKQYILNEINITDDKSFNKIMNILRFYMVKELPYEIYDYVIKNKPNLSNFKDFFFEEMSLLKDTKKDEIMNKSANKGYLNLMKYLHGNGYGWDEYTCWNVARNGHLDCLKYLYKNGCSWDEYTCWSAARNGHLNCLKYAHENGCKWHFRTCSIATWKGNLYCLKYAIENGCPKDVRRCIKNAKEKNHKHILEYFTILQKTRKKKLIKRSG